MTIKRRVRIDGDVAYVPLTQGYQAVIDVADVPLVTGFNWTAKVKCRSDGRLLRVYACRNDQRGKRQKLVMMHRLICGTPDGLETDHIDGDGLNNRRANLRSATKSQNLCNTRLRLANSSGAKGVSWNKNAAKWQAQIAIHGQKLHLGYYNTIQEAACAYARASAEHHQDFGRLG